MSFRSLSRAGIGLGVRIVGNSKNVVKVTHVAGAERKVSSWVGQGQDHFRRPHPSSRPGSLGAGTQLFKLVETDLMSKELTRYGPSDAEHLGLYSVQDVISEIAHATSPPKPENAVDGSLGAPPLKTASNVAAPQEKSMSTEAAAVRGGKVLAAWGMGQGTAQTAEDVKADEGAEEALPEGTGAVQEKMAIKRTYQPSTLKRKRKHGFLYRAKTRLGKKIMRRRQEKGRWRLGI